MSAQIIEVKTEPAAARFLAGEGLRPGAEITLIAVGAQGTRLIEKDQGYLEITPDIARTIQLLPSTSAA